MSDEPSVLAPAALPTHIVIRPAVAADLPGLEWSGEFWHLRDHFRQAYDAQLAGQRLFLVADASSFPVGRAILQFAGGSPHFADGHTRGYIYSLQVMASLRGLGIGTRLIEAAEQELSGRGFGWATIAVARSNDAARRLYERLGYAVFRADPGRWHYVDPAGETHRVAEPSWLMQKRLSPRR